MPVIRAFTHRPGYGGKKSSLERGAREAGGVCDAQEPLGSRGKAAGYLNVGAGFDLSRMTVGNREPARPLLLFFSPLTGEIK